MWLPFFSKPDIGLNGYINIKSNVIVFHINILFPSFELYNWWISSKEKCLHIFLKVVFNLCNLQFSILHFVTKIKIATPKNKEIGLYKGGGMTKGKLKAV